MVNCTAISHTLKHRPMSHTAEWGFKGHSEGLKLTPEVHIFTVIRSICSALLTANPQPSTRVKRLARPWTVNGHFTLMLTGFASSGSLPLLWLHFYPFMSLCRGLKTRPLIVELWGCGTGETKWVISPFQQTPELWGKICGHTHYIFLRDLRCLKEPNCRCEAFSRLPPPSVWALHSVILVLGGVCSFLRTKKKTFHTTQKLSLTTAGGKTHTKVWLQHIMKLK